MAQWLTNLPRNHGVAGSIPGLAQWLSGLRIRHCHEPWYRSQMRLGSGVAVAKAGSYSSDSTPSLGTSICRGCGPRKDKKSKKKKDPRIVHIRCTGTNYIRTGTCDLAAPAASTSVSHLLKDVGHQDGKCQDWATVSGLQ